MASCTTNCFVPMVKVLDDAFGVDGRPHDHGPRLHQRPEPARPAAQGPPPGPGRGGQHRARLSTGAARATKLVVLPQMDGTARRVGPAGAGAVRLDHRLHVVVPASVGVAEVNDAFQAAARSGPLGRVLDYTEDPIVSSDIVGQPGLVHLRPEPHPVASRVGEARPW